MDECAARWLVVTVLAIGVATTARAQTRPYLDVAVDAAKWVRASGIRTERGLTWPADAAGIGAWLLRLDAFERGATTPRVRLPDSPF